MTEPAPDGNTQQGLQLYQAGRKAEAEQVCLAVLRQQPDHFDALHLLGVIAAQTGRTDRAVDLIRQAIALRPDAASAHNSLGNVLDHLGRFEEALASYRQSIALDPNAAAAHANCGAILRILGRPAEALVSCDQAIRLNPDFEEAHNNRGNVLHDLERYDEALASFDRAITLSRDFVSAHANRGAVLRMLRRPEDAVSACDAALARDPDFADAHNSRGNALRDQGRFADALACYDRAIALQPGFADAITNRGVVLADLCRFEEALESYDKAIEVKPELADAYKNQSLCYLALGDFERGWDMYEWRWYVRNANPRHNLSGLPWLGETPLDGKTILVHAEQGIGDSLQFCRYVPMLAERARVILDVQPALVRLLSGLPGVARVIASGSPLPLIDAWIPMMSLPLAFRTTLETIPATVAYLHADPAQSAAWRRRLAALPGLKVGLVWAGAPRPELFGANATDRRRSITLQHYAPLAAIPGVSLVSLQKGEPAAQARTPPEGMVLHDWTAELDDFGDTAALVDALDLVISVDTSVAHLAGALGKRLWVLNRYDQCWRWLIGRSDSPWYPSARLFRQAAPGEWSGVIQEVAAALLLLQATLHVGG